MRGVRAAQGPCEPGRTQPRVGDHDRRPGPPAGVRGRGEVGAGRDEQRDPVAGGDPVVGEPGGQLVHAPDEQVPGDRAATSARRRRGRGRRRGRRARPTTRGGRRRDRAAARWTGRPGRSGPIGRSRGRGRGRRRGGVGARRGRRSTSTRRRRLRRVLQHEVRRLLVALHVGVRQAGPQVAQVAVGEHRVARAPQQQHRHVVELADLLGDPVQRRRARVLGLERDVRHELLDGPPPRRRPYGAANASRTADGQRRPRERRRRPHEHRRRRAHRVPQRRRAGQPDQRGRRGAGGLVHGGVGQHDGAAAGRGGAPPSPARPPRPSRGPPSPPAR